MTERTFTDKNKNEWNWEESPETVEALKKMQEVVEKTKAGFAGNYQGPLYAPHPDLANGKKTN